MTTTQQVKIQLNEGIVKVYDIQSTCVKEVVFNPWDDEIKITFQGKTNRTYTYEYDVNFQRGFISRIGTNKSLGSFTSLSLKTLNPKK